LAKDLWVFCQFLTIPRSFARGRAVFARISTKDWKKGEKMAEYRDTRLGGSQKSGAAETQMAIAVTLADATGSPFQRLQTAKRRYPDSIPRF
jgi:hypothetical protein